MSKEWTMPRQAEVCAGCARAFAPGETFHAFLYEADEGYERRDYCVSCPPPAERTPLGAWTTRRPPPAERKGHVFDREAVYSFFERLEDASEPQQVQFRFVLALLLWRKKALILERTIEDEGREIWEFRAPRNDVTHRVERPLLDEQQLEDLSGQLEGLLASQITELPETADDPTSE